MAELADAADSKSADPCGRGGSTPPPGTNLFYSVLFQLITPKNQYCPTSGPTTCTVVFAAQGGNFGKSRRVNLEIRQGGAGLEILQARRPQEQQAVPRPGLG